MKIYGKDETQLKLTAAAKAAYDSIGNLVIEEYYLPGHIVSQHYVRGRMAYNLKGDWEGYQMTEVAVNEFLEGLYDDMQNVGQEMEGGAGDGEADDGV